MKKILITFIVLYLSFNPLIAQVSYTGTPQSFKTEGLSLYIPTINLPEIDSQKLLNEDKSFSDKGTPLRVGINHFVTLNMNNSGRWDILPNGDRIWRVSIKSNGALLLHLNFDQFQIPKGSEVFVYSPDHQNVSDKYDYTSVAPDQTFGTADIPGDEIILDYYQPAFVEGTPIISINQVGHTYKSISMDKGYHGNAEGNCHINVACDEVQPWRDQANAVVLVKITQGTDIYVCSGAMINNTRQDNTPYVFTAEHCYDPAVTLWRFVFEYQTSSCDAVTGSYNKYAFGGEVMARDDDSDFMLLKITGDINNNYKPNIFLAGWDRSENQPSIGAAIHHPGGDYKKYSKPRVITTGTGGYNKFWRVGWLLDPNNKGTTEPGSSGSPLFSAQGYIVGSLCCGTSSCVYSGENSVGPGGYDYYGKFSYSWTNNNNTLNAKKLQPWLDPDNWGNMALAGRYWNSTVAVNDNEISYFKVSPNPTKGWVTISDLSLNQPSQCLVFDALGKKVAVVTLFPENSHSINLSHLKNGVYFLEVHATNQILRSKLMITK
ncbi:MAG TPA: T9SS type A sorting domain-containing protein [Bacteroidales bacterium]|nr:T9SS type A sorting domain-containing protein [Bacteroidales bacterium]